MLVIAHRSDEYPPTRYTSSDTVGKIDYSIYGRLKFTALPPADAKPVLLLPAVGFDTVVLAQVCNIKTSVSDTFKKALIPWIAAGHKLIIHDSDTCGGGSIPDYSFLPYPFATSNPGAQGAKGDALVFVEENFIANAKAEDPGYLDLDSWLKQTNGNRNEIGDSNTVKAYDPHWCGHLFGTQRQRRSTASWRRTRTTAAASSSTTGSTRTSTGSPRLPAAADARAGAGVRSRQPAVLGAPGRLRHHDGPASEVAADGPGPDVRLPADAAVEPGIQGDGQAGGGDRHRPIRRSQYQFEPDTIGLSEIGKATLTVTTTKDSPPASRTLEVRGTDTGGKANLLCLSLNERRSGSIRW